MAEGDLVDDPAPRPFSDELEEWLHADASKTLGALIEVFGERAYAVTILLLMFLPATPLPTGGVTHVFEVVTVLIALQMVIARRTLWLPRGLQRRELGALTTGKAVPFIVRRIRWFERHSRPRLAALLDSRVALPFLGVVIIGFTVAAAIAPPFSGLDTLPALGVVCIALAMIIGDILLAFVGVVLGSVGVVLIITIGAALARFVRDLF